jgi:hypothetical protein
MTPEEARRLLVDVAAPFEAIFIDHIFSNEPLHDGYEAADPPHQALLRDAAELLVTTGESHYAGYVTDAQRVLRHRMEPQRLTRLVARYRDGGQHSAEELSHILSSQSAHLSDTDLDILQEDILQELFLAAPANHLIIGLAVLDRRPAGPASDALLAHVAESEDPVWLAAVCEYLTSEQVWGDDRLSVWYVHMRAKPMSVRRDTAAKVGARPWGLMEDLGLKRRRRR